jgi:hypothetical protein
MIKKEMAKRRKVKVDTLTPTEKWDKKTASEAAEEVEIRKWFQDEEDKRDFVDKTVKGDASETGLLKFIAPLMQADIYKNDKHPIPNNASNPKKFGLECYRESVPVHGDKKTNKFYEIKFSSDIKFNLMVRDLNPAEKSPTKDADNL